MAQPQHWWDNIGLINQLDLAHPPAEIEAEVEELTEWLEWLKKLSLEAETMRARLDKKRQEREETEARIAEIVERQIAETEQELEEQRLLIFQQQITWLKKRIDTVCDKIIRQMEARRQRLEKETAEQAVKAREDLRVWELFKRQILDPKKPSDLQPARTKHDYPKAEPIPLAESDVAAWQEFTQELMNPKKKVSTAQQAAEAKALALQRQKEDKLMHDFEAYQQKQAASDAENQAEWEAFVTQLSRRKR